MKKIKKYIHHSLCALAFLLGFGVVTHSAHTKDVTNYLLGLTYSANHAADIVKKVESASGLQHSAKVTADLHNHIEKQTFSSMVKNISDDTSRNSDRSYKRGRKSHLIEEDAYIEPDTESIKQLFQRALGLM